MQRGIKLVFTFMFVMGGLFVQQDGYQVVLAADTQAPTAPINLAASAVSIFTAQERGEYSPGRHAILFKQRIYDQVKLIFL